MAKRRGVLKLLSNWVDLNRGLMKLPEHDVAFLLAHEEATANRITFTMRLHSRLNKLRRERERRSLARSAGVVTQEGK